MQTKTQVKNRIIKTEMIDWQSLQFLQDDDFKEWTDEAKHSLKASIISITQTVSMPITLY